MHEIYSTDNGQIVQDDVKNCFHLDYKGNSYPLSVCALIALKSKLESIGVSEVLLCDSMYKHIEIVNICNIDRVLVLTIDEVIELREMIHGAFAMIELNSIVHEKVRKFLV